MAAGSARCYFTNARMSNLASAAPQLPQQWGYLSPSSRAAFQLSWSIPLTATLAPEVCYSSGAYLRMATSQSSFLSCELQRQENQYHTLLPPTRCWAVFPRSGKTQTSWVRFACQGVKRFSSRSRRHQPDASASPHSQGPPSTAVLQSQQLEHTDSRAVLPGAAGRGAGGKEQDLRPLRHQEDLSEKQLSPCSWAFPKRGSHCAQELRD